MVFLLQVGGGVIDQNVRQHYGKGRIAHEGFGAEHGMAQAFGLPLPYLHDGDAFGADGPNLF